MAPPGESLFSTEFFSVAANASCPHYKSPTALLSMPHGFDLDSRVPPTLWCIPYIFFWFFMRKMCKAQLPRVARWCGLRSPKIIEKFSYQMWLVLYYTASTLLGVWGYMDEPWFQFPIGTTACLGLFGSHPPTPTPFMEFAYQYQLGLYFAELFAIFNETRRSDFGEYVIHHVTTIRLVGMSSLALEMRVGCYVFFIHDIPDIFLSLAKCLHYLKHEAIVNVLFVFFVLTFFFNRLVCLPSATYCIFCEAHGPVVKHGESVAFAVLGHLLGYVLQALHVFWFAMIIKMIYRLATGVKGDVRSDDDDDDQDQMAAQTVAAGRASTRKSVKAH